LKPLLPEIGDCSPHGGFFNTIEPIAAVRGSAGGRPLRKIPDVSLDLLGLNSGNDAADKPGAVHSTMARLICPLQEFEPLFRHSGIETRLRALSGSKQNNRKNLHDRHRLRRARCAPGTSAGQF
jgi:hypothetical protein